MSEDRAASGRRAAPRLGVSVADSPINASGRAAMPRVERLRRRCQSDQGLAATIDGKQVEPYALVDVSSRAACDPRRGRRLQAGRIAARSRSRAGRQLVDLKLCQSRRSITVETEARRTDRQSTAARSEPRRSTLRAASRQAPARGGASRARADRARDRRDTRPGAHASTVPLRQDARRRAVPWVCGQLPAVLAVTHIDGDRPRRSHIRQRRDARLRSCLGTGDRPCERCRRATTSSRSMAMIGDGRRHRIIGGDSRDRRRDRARGLY